MIPNSATIAEAARQFVGALEKAQGESPRRTDYDLEEKLHALVVACGDCFLCEEGTCPHEDARLFRPIVDTPPL